MTYSQMSSIVDALCDAMDCSPVLNDTPFSMPIGSMSGSVEASVVEGNYGHGYQQVDHGHGYRQVEPPMVYNYGPMVDGPGMMAYYAPPFDGGNYGYPSMPAVEAYRQAPSNMLYNNYGPVPAVPEADVVVDSNNASPTHRRSSSSKKKLDISKASYGDREANAEQHLNEGN